MQTLAQSVILDTNTYPRPGTLDQSFSQQNLKDETGSLVLPVSLRIASDSKILILGLHGQIVRLNSDGSRDDAFRPPLALSIPDYCFLRRKGGLILQPDGRILVFDCSKTIAKPPVVTIIRLNSDGSLDSGFASTLAIEQESFPSSIILQPDGRIIAMQSAGADTNEVHKLTRLNSDGSMDASYQARFEGGFVKLAIQADGKLLACGSFTRVNGSNRWHLARLSMDGSVDETFQAPLELVDGQRYSGFDVAVGRDGRILISTSYEKGTKATIFRLHADGRRDPGFSSDFYALQIALHLEQPDGKWYVEHPSYEGNVMRLNPDGTVDRSFQMGAALGSSDWVHLGLQADEKLIVSGLAGSSGYLAVGRFHSTEIPFTFRSIARTSGRPVKLTLNVVTSFSYVIETSSDFRQWQPVQQKVATGDTLEFEDSNAANLPRRFYRARLVP